jgi:hypothetical protein
MVEGGRGWNSLYGTSLDDIIGREIGLASTCTMQCNACTTRESALLSEFHTCTHTLHAESDKLAFRSPHLFFFSFSLQIENCGCQYDSWLVVLLVVGRATVPFLWCDTLLLFLFIIIHHGQRGHFFSYTEGFCLLVKEATMTTRLVNERNGGIRRRTGIIIQQLAPYNDDEVEQKSICGRREVATAASTTSWQRGKNNQQQVRT